MPPKLCLIRALDKTSRAKLTSSFMHLLTIRAYSGVPVLSITHSTPKAEHIARLEPGPVTVAVSF
jgi:hypothetical protein